MGLLSPTHYVTRWISARPEMQVISPFCELSLSVRLVGRFTIDTTAYLSIGLDFGCAYHLHVASHSACPNKGIPVDKPIAALAYLRPCLTIMVLVTVLAYRVTPYYRFRRFRRFARPVRPSAASKLQHILKHTHCQTSGRKPRASVCSSANPPV